MVDMYTYIYIYTYHDELTETFKVLIDITLLQRSIGTYSKSNISRVTLVLVHALELALGVDFKSFFLPGKQVSSHR